MNNKFLALVFSVPMLISASLSYAANGLSSKDEHGCKAIMCFSGGMGLSECQSTIKKVYKDLAKGKSFPHCSFIGGSNDGNSQNANDPAISKFTTHNGKDNVYLFKDGILVKKIRKD